MQNFELMVKHSIWNEIKDGLTVFKLSKEMQGKNDTRIKSKMKLLKWERRAWMRTIHLNTTDWHLPLLLMMRCLIYLYCQKDLYNAYLSKWKSIVLVEIFCSLCFKVIYLQLIILCPRKDKILFVDKYCRIDYLNM